MDIAALVTLGIAVLSLGGIIVTAMKYNRDDTTAIVGQQTQILENMHTLNDELRIRSDSLKSERDELAGQITGLKDQIEQLRAELQRALGGR